MNKNELYLVKVGGSLMSKNQQFNDLIDFLAGFMSKRVSLVITTGSKELSDIVRSYVYEILGSTNEIQLHVDITMKSRDIMANSFASLHNNFHAVNTIDGINSSLNDGCIPVVLQYDILRAHQPGLLGKGISTDTTSAFLAYKLGVDKFIKLSNVDGVFENFGTDKNPIPEISTIELEKKGTTCIDGKLANYLQSTGQSCYVLNGNNIENLKNFLIGGESVYTKVYPII